MKPRLLNAFGLLAGLLSAGAFFGAFFWAWAALSPLEPDEARSGLYRCLACSAVACASGAGAVVLTIRSIRAGGIRRVRGWIAALLFAGAVAGGAIWCVHHRWDLRMLGVPSAYDLPVDTSGYTIEKLRFAFLVSFARGEAVYFADHDGAVYRADDRDPAGTRVKIGESGVRPRMIFVNSRGTIFVSGDGQPLVRSADSGAAWEKCLDWSFWRMDEDEASGALYAGNYSQRNHPVYRATVFKSVDDGRTWRQTFTDERLDHVHTVRVDPKYGRIYLAAGDTDEFRGQAYSQDGGATWRWLMAGRKQGHTDVGISESHVFWGSDDWMGRVIRAPRETVEPGRTVLWCRGQQAWSVVAEGRCVFVGTFIQDAKDAGAALLLASCDEGRTWQKLLEHRAPQPGMNGIIGESRRLSAGGWLYFTTTEGQAYRARKAQPTSAPGGG